MHLRKAAPLLTLSHTAPLLTLPHAFVLPLHYTLP